MKNPDEKILVNVRMTRKEKRQMQDLANKYTDGNLSEWIKVASMNHTKIKVEDEALKKHFNKSPL